MSAARVPIVPRLVGSLDTFTVSQLDSFIAIRRVINLEIIWWRQPVHRRFYGRQRDVFAAVLSRVKVYTVKYEKYVHHLTAGSWTHRWDRNRWSWKRSDFLLTTRWNMRRFVHTSLTNTNLFLCSSNYNMLSNWCNRVLMYSWVSFEGWF